MGPRERQALAQGLLSKQVGCRVGLPCSAHWVHTSIPAIPVHWPGPSGWWCCAVYSLWPGHEGWEGSGWEAGAACPRLEGGRRLAQTQSPLFASTARQLVWDFWEVFFFSPFLSFFYLRRIIALSRGSQDSKSLCRPAGQPKDVLLDQSVSPHPLLPSFSLSSC